MCNLLKITVQTAVRLCVYRLLYAVKCYNIFRARNLELALSHMCTNAMIKYKSMEIKGLIIVLLFTNLNENQN